MQNILQDVANTHEITSPMANIDEQYVVGNSQTMPPSTYKASTLRTWN